MVCPVGPPSSGNRAGIAGLDDEVWPAAGMERLQAAAGAFRTACRSFLYTGFRNLFRALLRIDSLEAYQIMKISNIGSTKSTRSAKKKAKTGKTGKGSEFAEQLKEAGAAADTQASVEPAAINPAEAVLAVQETNDATQGRSRGLVLRYGNGVLDRLDNLRHEILSGAVPKESLALLARKMRAERQTSNDPRLNEIINEIELRAEVEIAKLTSSKQP